MDILLYISMSKNKFIYIINLFNKNSLKYLKILEVLLNIQIEVKVSRLQDFTQQHNNVDTTIAEINMH